MRILFIDKFYPPRGGVGAYTQSIVPVLRRRGHQVLQFGTVGGDRTGRFPRFNDFTRTGFLTAPLALAKMVHNTEAANSLQRFLRHNRVDVAHLHNIYHHLTPSILPVLARRGVGIVLRLADYRLACPNKHFLRPDGHCMRCQANRFYHAAGQRCGGWSGLALAIESYVHRLGRSYFKWVDFFICPTRFMRQVMLRAGVPADKCVVLRNAVAPLPVQAPGAPGQQGPRELLFAGRMSFEKAPEMMLELARRMPDVHVTLAGDGPMLEQLRSDARQQGLRNVTFAGQVGRDRLGRLVQRAAAVVITSRWLENSTMSMLEGMGAGRCVIVPDRGPLKEWVCDGQTGRLYRPDDLTSLEQVVGEVLSDAAGRKRMDEAAARLVARRHDPQRIAERLEILYEEAIRRCALRW